MNDTMLVTRLIVRVFVLATVIPAFQDLAHAQKPSASQQTTSPVSTTINEGAEQKRTASVQHPAVSRDATSSCSLQAPETFVPNSQVSQSGFVKGVVPYTPLSSRCKFDLFLHQTYSPYTFASAAFQATWDQAQGTWPHFGGGVQGWGKRFGTTLTDTESRRFIQGFALSTLLHQDPRYFPSDKQHLVSRAWYAMTRVAIVKNDNGTNTFNTSEFLGTLLSSSLQNAYYPRPDRTFGDTMSRYGSSLSSDALNYLLREFTPDMKRLFKKHAPKDIQKLEHKLPIPADDKP